MRPPNFPNVSFSARAQGPLVDLNAGRLVQWGDVEGPEIVLWALHPSRRLLSARVAAFLDHLKAAFPLGAPNELANYIDDGAR